MTPEALRQFGNETCRYDEIADMLLSARDRKEIAEIIADERRNGCSC